MISDNPGVRSVISRQPVHPSITTDQISVLVDSFYEKIRNDDRLGPVFNGRINDNWVSHLDKMKSFWRSVLLKTGEYKGRPLPVHARMNEVNAEDYKIWLRLFQETVSEHFTPEAAPLVFETALRIAHSFWLGIYALPLETTPDFLKN